MRVSAEDFLSGTPPRIMGTECEYDLQSLGPSGFPDRGVHQRQVVHEILGAVQKELIIKHIGQFLSNGARLYKDVGHLEYATAECLGPAQAVAADFAGLIIIAKIIEDHNKQRREDVHLYRHTGSFMPPKQSRQPTVTHGYHENYLIPNPEGDRIYDYSIFKSYLATRVWAAAGGVAHNGYIFSQKSQGIRVESKENASFASRVSEGYKPLTIIHNQDDTMSNQYPEWARLEVRLADAGLSKDARFLAMASASLALRLVEHAEKLRPHLRRISLINPGQAARTFAEDLTFKETADTRNGEALTWINIQELLIEAVYHLKSYCDLPDEEEAALLFWEDTIEDAISSDPLSASYPERFRERFDMAGRHYFLSNKVEGELTTRNAEAITKSLAWERVHPTGISMRYFDLQASQYVSEVDIESLITTAPSETRAARRAKIIESSSNRGSITWSTYRPHRKSHHLSLGPIYNSLDTA